MQRAGSILTPAIKRLGIEESVRLLRITSEWDAIFGKPLSLHMSPSRLLEGELLLNTDSPIWMQQLQFCHDEILGKLKPYGVMKVRFRIGKVSSAKKREPEHDPAARGQLSSDDARFVDSLIAPVKDAALKAAIRTAAVISLSSKTGKPR